jgi:parallel beta-helix repeat protein
MKGKTYVSIAFASLLLFSSFLGFQAQSGTATLRIVWQQKTDVPTARGYLLRGQSVVGQSIYAVGGWNGSILDSVEIYDVASATWTAGQSLPQPREDGAIQVVDDKLYIIGGDCGGPACATVLEYDPSSNTYASKEPMPTARRSLASAVIDGKIYTIGGVDAMNQVSASVEMYDPSTNTWETKSPHPLPRQYLTAEVVNGKIYTFGGNEYSNRVHEYDPILDSWTEKSPVPLPIPTPNSVTVDDRIFVLGGDGSTNVLVYNASTDKWEGILDALPGMQTLALTAEVSGKIYIIGGIGSSGYSASVEEGTILTVPIEPKTIVVPDDYATIQDAINNANNWDTVFVKNGTYAENLVVNKTVTLEGEDKTTVVIDGNKTGPAVIVDALNVTIEGFTITNGTDGIELFSSGSTIRNNILTNSASIYLPPVGGNGILASNSLDCTIGNNLIFSNENTGIEIDSSERILVDNNTIDDNGGGIFLSASTECTLRRNKITGHSVNFGVDGWGLSPYVHDIDTSNTINGKPIMYIVSQRDLRLDPTSYPDPGYLALINSTNIVVKDFVFRANYQGLLLVSTNNSLIENVVVSNNSYGIHSYYSENNEVIDCVASENYEGVFLRYSRDGNDIVNLTADYNSLGMFIGDCGHLNIAESNVSLNEQYGIFLTACYYGMNTMNYNTISNNRYCGIFLDYSPTNLVDNVVSNNGIGLIVEYSSEGTICHNSFVNNTEQAVRNYAAPTWDYGYPSGGNYWSDYNGTDFYSGVHQNESGGDGIGDTPYAIDGSSFDNYPLMQPYASSLGDVNHDGIVDISDAISMAAAFGSYPGHPNWNGQEDLNHDGQIDILDVIILASNFGKR